jgi:hypothetical protein
VEQRREVAEAVGGSQGRVAAGGRSEANQSFAERKTMTSLVNNSVIVSRYGNRVVRWNAASLYHALNQLRSERETCPRGHQMPDNGADTATVPSQAEKLEAATTNHIHKALSSA